MRHRRSSNRLGIVGITMVVVVLSCVLTFNIINSNDKLSDLSNQEKKLENQLKSEQTRSEELEEQKKYVKTKKYIEEVAKKFGLVYPDEIIFKPKD